MSLLAAARAVIDAQRKAPLVGPPPDAWEALEREVHAAEVAASCRGFYRCNREGVTAKDHLAECPADALIRARTEHAADGER